MFPIDPRDFISPSTIAGDTINCIADNVVATDSPSVGSLFSWNLGDPFFKSYVDRLKTSSFMLRLGHHSNVVAFHFGNLTHPSVDPPRIGLLSTVPNNADSLLQNAIQDAVENGGKFECECYSLSHFPPLIAFGCSNLRTCTHCGRSRPSRKHHRHLHSTRCTLHGIVQE